MPSSILRSMNTVQKSRPAAGRVAVAILLRLISLVGFSS
jgi:hypothetical protein